jgi:hypothetical protein
MYPLILKGDKMILETIIGLDLLLMALVSLVFIVLLVSIYAASSGLYRAILVVGTLISIPSILLALVVSLGQPRPITFNFSQDKYVMLSYYFQDQIAINLWLIPTDNFQSSPISISIPWSDELAQKIQDAGDNASNDEDIFGVGIEIENNLLFERSLNEDMMQVYEIPVPRTAYKEEIPDSVIQYYEDAIGQ